MEPITRFIHLKHHSNKELTFSSAGTYVIFFHNISGKVHVKIQSPNIQVYIFGLFTGEKKDEFHIETIQEHLVGNSFSDLLIKGVFRDAAKLSYQGLIKIEKGAQQSHAYQKNQNLILSSEAFVDSRPFLEIQANDVFCTHGSTTGKLNNDQLFYLQARGLTQTQAKELLVEGFIQELYEKIHQIYPEFTQD